jgi:sodium/potassium/calcium exchanger 6
VLVITSSSSSPKRKRINQTKTAAILTLATLLLLAIVSITTHVLQINTDHINNRLLEDNDNDNDNDYSQYTCDDIFVYTEANTADRCSFAKTCNASQGLFLSFAFCSTYNLSLTTWCLILSPFLLIWLVLLFRMLGSTAEDFFSPSLEMFSMKMGLPPRFAGVTLLALGNGAADVSATISAIAQNPQEGYLMSLGALTGAGMFVGTVVAGIVIVVADGVKCRGALVRDLFMFIITLIVVYVYFDRGEIGPDAIHCFFWLYFSFVVVVLVADVYHRAVVLPRIRKEEEFDRRTSQSQTETFSDNVGEVNAINGKAQARSAPAMTSALGSGMASGNSVNFNLDSNVENAPPASPTNGIELADARTSSTLFHTPVSSESEFPSGSPLQIQAPGTGTGTGTDTGVESPPPKRGKIRRAVDRVMVAMSNYGPDEGKNNPNQSFYHGWSNGLEVNSERDDEQVKLHGPTGILTKTSSIKEEEEETPALNQFETATSYRVLMEGVDNMCTVEGSLSSGMDITWGNTWATFQTEFTEHFQNYNKEIWENEENNAFDKFFLVMELPFTVLRKLSVPIPCDDYYCRAIIAASTAFTPIWIGVYAMLQHDSNLFWFGGFPYIEIFTFFSLFIGFLLIKFAPADEADMSLRVSVSTYLHIIDSS